MWPRGCIDLTLRDGTMDELPDSLRNELLEVCRQIIAAGVRS
jgi:hypothetical protein